MYQTLLPYDELWYQFVFTTCLFFKGSHNQKYLIIQALCIIPGIVQFGWPRFWVQTCVFVCDVWYEMCVLIPSSVIWTCGSSSPADFIISTRLLCALLLCLLSVCNVVLWTLLCCLLCEPLCTWCSLCCGNGISNWCHHCTAMWHLISVIFIDLHRFSVEKTQHFK